MKKETGKRNSISFKLQIDAFTIFLCIYFFRFVSFVTKRHLFLLRMYQLSVIGDFEDMLSTAIL